MTRDPTKEDMERILAQAFQIPLPQEDMDVQDAVWWFAANHHSGQGSNLYEALSMSAFHPGALCTQANEGTASEMYYTLVAAYVP